MHETNASVFRLERVCFRYDSVPAPLFQDLDLEVRAGESVALIGPSGEGKSTLLKLMTGLLRPERGQSSLFGRPFDELTHLERRDLMRRIGMTFQNSGLFDSLSCGENLAFPLWESGIKDPGEVQRRIKQALQEVGLSGIEGLRTHQISGGMRKRLGIARAHMLAPSVVLYDEPTAGLDPLTSRAITELILKLKNEHRVTVVVVTNDPAQAFQVAERICFVGGGKIVKSGLANEIRESSDPAVRDYLGAFHHLAFEGDRS